MVVRVVLDGMVDGFDEDEDRGSSGKYLAVSLPGPEFASSWLIMLDGLFDDDFDEDGVD